MPDIVVNRKTGEIEIEGDCGSQWGGSCSKIKVTKDKIALECDTELIEECEDMRKERAREINERAEVSSSGPMDIIPSQYKYFINYLDPEDEEGIRERYWYFIYLPTAEEFRDDLAEFWGDDPKTIKIQKVKHNPGNPKKKLTVLTDEEEVAWNFAWEFYVNEGYEDNEAAELAWKDLQIEFPRLKGYDGIKSDTNNPGNETDWTNPKSVATYVEKKGMAYASSHDFAEEVVAELKDRGYESFYYFDKAANWWRIELEQNPGSNPGKRKPKRAIEEYDIEDSEDMAQMVIDHGWAQVLKEALAIQVVDTLVDKGFDAFYFTESWGKEDFLYRIVPVTEDEDLQREYLETFVEQIMHYGEGSTDDEALADDAVRSLKKMGIGAAYDFTPQFNRFKVYLTGKKKKNPGSNPGPACPPGQEETDGFCAQRLEDPEHFDKRSFRTTCPKCPGGECDRCEELGIELDDTPHLVIGCPEGEYDPKTDVCKTSTRGQSILRPKSHASRYGPKAD